MIASDPLPPEFGRSSPAALGVIATGGRYKLAPHLAFLNRKLVELASGKIKRLAISWPPRHGKSELCSVLLPAWFLGLFAQSSVLLASYEAGVAANFSAKARDILRDVGEEVFEIKVSSEVNARDNWGIANARGTMRSAGVGGPLTGFGASLLICDDLFKNAIEANSPLYRDRVDDWFRSVALTRLEPGARVVLIGTRWHQDDLFGRITARKSDDAEPWTIVNIPALADDDDPLGREPGAALWPARFDRRTLEATRGEVGAYVFNALYQGQPSPGEGTVFRREWFVRRYSSLHALPPVLPRSVMAIDGAWKMGTSNSRSAIAVWTSDGTDRYLLDAWAARVQYPELRSKVADVYNKWSQRLPGLLAYVEDAASGVALLQELRIPCKAAPARESKIMRAERITPMLEGGRCVFPASAPWFDEWLEEMLGFPFAANNDQVDATVHALDYLSEARRMSFASVAS